MSTFWSLWIIILTSTLLVLLAWLLYANWVGSNTGESTGHDYDGIEEIDNPLPAWWSWLFVATFIYSAYYLAAYPGMGSYKGFLGWTSTNQWEAEIAEAEKKYRPVYASFSETPIKELAQNPKAMEMAQRVYGNNCAVCHGSTARGADGYPNLADSDWLYGGDPETIKTTITHGRQGAMPGWSETLGEKGVYEVADYVLSLSDREHDASKAEAGAKHYQMYCMACHAADGKGSQAVGAPNLADDIWLYKAPGKSIAQNVRDTIRWGRNGQMPAHKDMLNEDKIHLLAAYVYKTSN